MTNQGRPRETELDEALDHFGIHGYQIANMHRVDETTHDEEIHVIFQREV